MMSASSCGVEATDQRPSQEMHMAEETIMAQAIALNSPNPSDITPKEIEDIAIAIRGLNLNCEVRTSVTQREGLGITWFEILRITLMGGAFGAGKPRIMAL
jgi:hypothetical protein